MVSPPDYQPVMTDATRRWIAEVAEIEFADAKAAGALGFMATTFAQLTLPHKQIDTLYYTRTNGQMTLAVRAHQGYGMPYGSRPRQFLAWICSESMKSPSRELHLGRSLRAFAMTIGVPTGGDDLKQLRKQCLALMRSVISIDNEAPGRASWIDVQVATRGFVSWDAIGGWDGLLVLSEDFHKMVRERQVPLDLRAYRALSKHPMAMDLYAWLIWRMFVLRVSGRPSARIPLSGLARQFGAGYSTTQAFREKGLVPALSKALALYPDAAGHVNLEHDSLRLTPCRLQTPHTRGARLSRLAVAGQPPPQRRGLWITYERRAQVCVGSLYCRVAGMNPWFAGRDLSLSTWDRWKECVESLQCL